MVPGERSGLPRVMRVRRRRGAPGFAWILGARGQGSFDKANSYGLHLSMGLVGVGDLCVKTRAKSVKLCVTF